MNKAIEKVFKYFKIQNIFKPKFTIFKRYNNRHYNFLSI